MVDESIVNIIRRYLEVVVASGIHAEKAILFGSYARGTQRPESDIDVIVLAEEFDQNNWEIENELWRLILKADTRIQPWGVGIRQYIEDDVSPVIEMARREGIEIRRQ